MTEIKSNSKQIKDKPLKKLPINNINSKKVISNSMPQVLTCIIACMLSIMIFILAFKDIIQSNKEVFTLIIGGLMGILSTSSSYWFDKKYKVQTEENKKDDQ